MRKVFADALKRNLRTMFLARFPVFKPYKPTQTPEDKQKYALPLSTDYFCRFQDNILEILGIRRLSQDTWTLEIFWSVYGKFPSSRLLCDVGIQDLEKMVKQPEAHTCASTIAPQGVSGNWQVWQCSATTDDDDYKQRYITEYMQEIIPEEAEKKVIAQLNATFVFIDKYVLPFFERVEANAGESDDNRLLD